MADTKHMIGNIYEVANEDDEDKIAHYYILSLIVAKGRRYIGLVGVQGVIWDEMIEYTDELTDLNTMVIPQKLFNKCAGTGKFNFIIRGCEFKKLLGLGLLNQL
jgi:hypothetical protein